MSVFNGLDVIFIVAIVFAYNKCKTMAKDRDGWRHDALEISKELKDTKEMVRKLRDAVRKLQ